ncbi:DUF4222 domain-containing protein [Escherichia coli]|nr:DUF4222 domain-containing protein [Escherichia coli]MCW3283361.1 DUF4222 domain-containing protein [Escherichia coli]
MRLGDIYRDTRRGRVVIRHVTPGNITYRRDFTLVDHYKAVNQKRAASYIRKIREMLVAGGKNETGTERKKTATRNKTQRHRGNYFRG